MKASSDYHLVGSPFKRKCGLEVVLAPRQKPSTGAALGFFDAYTLQPWLFRIRRPSALIPLRCTGRNILSEYLVSCIGNPGRRRRLPGAIPDRSTEGAATVRL